MRTAGCKAVRVGNYGAKIMTQVIPGTLPVIKAVVFIMVVKKNQLYPAELLHKIDVICLFSNSACKKFNFSSYLRRLFNLKFRLLANGILLSYFTQ